MLVTEPEALIEEWCFRVHDFVQDMDTGRQQLLAQLVSEQHGPRTRQRLETLYQKLGEHQARVTKTLLEAGLRAKPRPGSRPVAPVPGEESILAYYTQIHRDWGWDGSANSEARDATRVVSNMIGDIELGSLLVLGGGACRLTQDLHHRHAASTTLALDLNPLPYIVAQKLLGAEPVELFEFPPWPRDSNVCFAERTLSSKLPPDDALGLVFADGLNPPLRPASIDSVLTPWFIDQIPRNMTTLFAKIWDVLKPGGYWMNFGPLIYPAEHTALPHRYCVDEVLELVEDQGFSVEASSFERMSYLESPISGQGRVETVLTFRARKGEPRGSRTQPAKPSWLEHDDEPVPRLAGLEQYAPPHPMFAAIVALIDGQRSAADIARCLVTHHGLPEAAALSCVVTCLAEISRKTQSSASSS